MRPKGEKQKKETHRKPAPSATTPPGTPLLKTLLIPPLQLSGGTSVHLGADIHQLDHTLVSSLPLNSEPSGGRGVGYSLHRLGREKKERSEG